jgi:hypothetical protein
MKLIKIKQFKIQFYHCTNYISSLRGRKWPAAIGYCVVQNSAEQL